MLMTNEIIRIQEAIMEVAERLRGIDELQFDQLYLLLPWNDSERRRMCRSPWHEIEPHHRRIFQF